MPAAPERAKPSQGRTSRRSTPSGTWGTSPLAMAPGLGNRVAAVTTAATARARPSTVAIFSISP